MLNTVLIIILILFIIIQVFAKPERESLKNISVLNIIHRLISHPNIKDPQEPDKLINFIKK
jgi:hypothetical protein